jgi:selenocysteine lyase/cysteine desulfurase
MELHGLDACLELLLETGVERMAPAILAVTDRLAAGLEQRGWQLLSPRGPAEECSGIVTAAPPGHDADAVAEALERQGVSVTARGGGVRFSPHAWNTADEVDAALDRLP